MSKILEKETKIKLIKNTTLEGAITPSVLAEILSDLNRDKIEQDSLKHYQNGFAIGEVYSPGTLSERVFSAQPVDNAIIRLGFEDSLDSDFIAVGHVSRYGVSDISHNFRRHFKLIREGADNGKPLEITFDDFMEGFTCTKCYTDGLDEQHNSFRFYNYADIYIENVYNEQETPYQFSYNLVMVSDLDNPFKEVHFT